MRPDEITKPGFYYARGPRLVGVKKGDWTVVRVVKFPAGWFGAYLTGNMTPAPLDVFDEFEPIPAAEELIERRLIEAEVNSSEPGDGIVA